MKSLPFDLTDLNNFAHGFPHDLFAVLTTGSHVGEARRVARAA